MIGLPPHTPELQPAEDFRRLVDEPILNRHFHRPAEIQERIDRRCRDLAAGPGIVRADALVPW